MKKFLNLYNSLKIKSKILCFSGLIALLFIIAFTISIKNSVIPFVHQYAVDIAKNRYDYLKMLIVEQNLTMAKDTNIIANTNAIKQSIFKKDSTISAYLKNFKTKADIIFILDRNGSIIASNHNRSSYGEKTSLNHVIQKAMIENKEINSFEILTKKDLLAESNSLYEKVKMTRKETKGYKKGFIDKYTEEDALVNTVITPVKNDFGQVIGAVAALEILNRNYKYVDLVKKGDEGIAATIFKDDLRITTSVPGSDNGRATGTLLSEKVVDKVLINQEDFVGRANVAGIPMWSYYVPLKNSMGKTIGIFFVAMSEKQVMNIVLSSFLKVIAISLFVVIAIFIPTVIFFSNKFSIPINNLAEVSKKISDGDLTAEIKKSGLNDEIGYLENNFSIMTNNLRKLIGNVLESVDNVSKGSAEISVASNQTAEGAQQVAISVGQLASGSQEQANNVGESLDNINQVNIAVKRIYDNAEKTVDLSKSTENNAQSGALYSKKAIEKINEIKDIATDASQSINQLGKLSEDIEQIVDLIKGIANQTNLLALNAAIEAARAGEHGKGFAVVAEEVKKLAGQSAEATDKITLMIKEIQTKTNGTITTINEVSDEVENGVNIVSDAEKALTEILLAAKLTSEQIAAISLDVNTLAENSDKVVRMMENVSSITEETSASAEEIASITEEQSAGTQQINASAQDLSKTAENLKKQIAVFRI
ncbi:MAG: methyl-accepting chemotaxis protein [Candidatus Gastranaerophilales bacterium]|nr:methyl-accepting chemotaxis protein [Candidatus Gastranaerophilales bacterium]